MDTKILVIDDDKDYLDLMVMHLKRKGYQVEGTSVVTHALTLLGDTRNNFAVLVTDWMMPGMSGNNLVKMAKQINPTIEAIVITAMGQMGLSGKLKYGAFDFLTKPLVSMKELSEMVQRALDHRTEKILSTTIRKGHGDN